MFKGRLIMRNYLDISPNYEDGGGIIPPLVNDKVNDVPLAMENLVNLLALLTLKFNHSPKLSKEEMVKQTNLIIAGRHFIEDDLTPLLMTIRSNMPFEDKCSVLNKYRTWALNGHHIMKGLSEERWGEIMIPDGPLINSETAKCHVKLFYNTPSMLAAKAVLTLTQL